MAAACTLQTDTAWRTRVSGLAANQIFKHSFERACQVSVWQEAETKGEVLQEAVITGAGGVVGSL